MTSSSGSEPLVGSIPTPGALGERRVGRIPLRNLWLLMLYASDIARYKGRSKVNVEEDVSHLPDLVGRLIAREVDRRIRRNLTRGYRQREAIMPRLRGRFVPLETMSRRLLDKGEVACRFDELTIDTPRNRYVRAALERLGRLIADEDLKLRCRALALTLARAGVAGTPPSRSELARESFGRNDAEDRFLLALAKLAFDLSLPTEDSGTTDFTSPERDEHWVRRLFEKAVLGFYKAELEPQGWGVDGGTMLSWQTTSPSSGILAILPSMRTDVLLEAPDGRRIILDTKFTGILRKGWFREETIKSGYLYQIYAYVRSQEEQGQPAWNHAEGILVHPSIGHDIDERVTIQGHQLRFVTVDLSVAPNDIRQRLRAIVG